MHNPCQAKGGFPSDWQLGTHTPWEGAAATFLKPGHFLTTPRAHGSLRQELRGEAVQVSLEQKIKGGNLGATHTKKTQGGARGKALRAGVLFENVKNVFSPKIAREAFHTHPPPGCEVCMEPPGVHRQWSLHRGSRPPKVRIPNCQAARLEEKPQYSLVLTRLYLSLNAPAAPKGAAWY